MMNPSLLFLLLVFALIFALSVAQKQDTEPIQVHFIIHSHQDPGWIVPFDDYTWKTRRTYDTFQEISHNFVYQEMSFLDDAVSKKPLKLETAERMEFVGGGWTLSDEACPTYQDYLRNMFTGHQYAQALMRHVGQPEPKIQALWNIDPFGHSRTISLDMALAMGIKYVVLNRIDQKLKNQLKDQKNLQFYWCKSEDQCILTHVLQDHYSAPKGFHFDGAGGGDYLSNVETKAISLIEQVKKQAQYFRTKQILIPYGDDFTHTSAMPVENLEKVLKEIRDNSADEKYAGVKFQFSTLSTYFSSLEKELQDKKIELQQYHTESRSDFFPYTHGVENDKYWTGYYTSHPMFKRQVRETSNLLRTAEIMSSFHMIQDSKKQNTTWHNEETELDDLSDTLLDSSRQLSLAQHHDAITGTSKSRTRRDFKERLVRSVQDTKLNVLQPSLSVLIRDTERQTIRVLTSEETLDVKKGQFIPLIVMNNLGYDRSDYCSIYISREHIRVYTLDGDVKRDIPFDILADADDHLELIFLAKNIPALGFRTVFVEYDAQTKSHVREYEAVAETTLSVKNTWTKLEFSEKALTSIAISEDAKSFGMSVTASHSLMVYNTSDSGDGAYVFIADHDANAVQFFPKMSIAEGEVMTEIRLHDGDAVIGENVRSPLTMTYRLYHSQDIRLGRFVEVTVTSDITSGTFTSNDLISRFQTDLSSGDVFFTDANGYQMQKRKREDEKGISGNYSPATQCMWIKDDTHQFSLLLHQAHGVSSQSDGSVEVMLARSTRSDDGWGANEPLRQDTRPSIAQFRFMLSPSSIDEHTVTSMAREFDHQFIAASHSESGEFYVTQLEYQSKHTTSFSPLNNTYPRLHILTLSPLVPLHLDEATEDTSTHQKEHSRFLLRLQNLDTSNLLKGVNLVDLFNLPNRRMQNITEWTVTLLSQKDQHFDPFKLSFAPNEIRTFIIQFEDTSPKDKDQATSGDTSIFAYLLGVVLALCFCIATVVLIVFFIVGSIRRRWVHVPSHNWMKLEPDTLDMDSSEEIERLQLEDSRDEFPEAAV